MKKILIFGTGEGGLNFIKNTPNQYNYLAFVDNNPTKWGEILNNLKIISPKEITAYNYDEIVIASYWASSIQKQLINDYGINEEQIFIPPKEMLMHISQPFQDKNTINFAQDIITLFSKEAINADIPLFVNNGTLLGIIRDNKILSWDSDIDLAILYDNILQIDMESFILKTIKKLDLTQINITVTKVIDNTKKVLSYKIDFHKNNCLPFPLSIEYMSIENEYVIEMVSLGQFKVPKKHILSLDRYVFFNQTIYIPNQVEEYLSFIYGNDWKTPKKNISFNDYNNYNEVSKDIIFQANIKQLEIFKNEIKE
jgi:phosphorylcholine metabolism protein LicD